MAISTTAGAPPIFLSPSYVNKASDLIGTGAFWASSMQGIAHRIYQMDPSAYWQGSLGADDTLIEYFVIGLYQGSNQLAVSLDSFLLLNHNLNNFRIDYCTDFAPGGGGSGGSGTWQTLVNVAGQAGADWAYFAASPIANVNGLRLAMSTTSPANQQKQLGNFIAALSTFQLSQPPSKLKPIFVQRRVDVTLPDGTTDSTYFLWSDNSFTLVNYEFEFDFLNLNGATDKANIEALLKARSPFLLYPEPGDDPRSIFLSLFEPSSYVPDYNTQNKGGGRKIGIRTKNVGYL